MHHPLVHELLYLVQQGCARRAVADAGLLLEQGVEIGSAAIGVEASPEHIDFELGGGVAHNSRVGKDEFRELFLLTGGEKRGAFQGL